VNNPFFNLDPTQIAVAARAGLNLPKQDPLRFRRMCSVAQRDFCEYVAQGIDTYLHGGNGVGKTEGAAHLFIAMCRGITRLDGRLMVRPGDPPDALSETEHWITLPGLINGNAWRHWVIVNSYDQAKDSSMRSYRKLIGNHPHEIGWLERDKGKVKLIRVKPDGWESDDDSTWSEITFISQEQMTDEDVRMVQGARVNSVHGDEMPKEAVWREVRARKDANIPIYLGITATPEYRREWAWALKDYRACFRRPLRGRVRLQVSVEDNRALSREDIEKRREMYAGDDLFDARWNGEHCDVTGACPFPTAPIRKLLEKCRPGRFETITVRADPKNDWEPDYRDILPAKLEVERWLEYEHGHAYLITADTSRGIDDEKHDPAELELWDWTEPMLVLRFGQRSGKGGYVDEDTLALLADKLGREYGNALIDVEVTSGMGVQFVGALRKLRYPNLARDDKTVSPGVVREEYGWVASPTTNGESINAIIKGLNEDSFLCWSQDVLQQWLDVRERGDGRTPEVKPGERHHREAMICAGRALHWIQSKPPPVILQRRRDLQMARALRKEFGRDVMVGRAGSTRTRRTGVYREESS
jgi:hypothetical protein